MSVLTGIGTVIKEPQIREWHQFNDAKSVALIIKCDCGLIVGDCFGGLVSNTTKLLPGHRVSFSLSRLKLLTNSSGPYLCGRIVEIEPVTSDNSSVITESNIVKIQSTSQFASSNPLVNARSPHSDFNYDLNAETAISEENTVSEEDVPW